MLDTYLVHNPDGWDGRIREGERAPREQLTYDEWQAIFFITLMGYCPMYEYYVEGQDWDEQNERYRITFQQAIPDYPLLGRMWDQYTDATYQPEEVSRLHAECLKVQSLANNLDASTGLDKLARFCKEAEEKGLGLFLACD